MSKVCVVTGAGSGIGKCLTQRLLAENAVVFATDINVEALRALSEDAGKFGRSLYCVQMDVRKNEELSQLLGRVIDSEGKLDVWINNAGISGLGSFLEQTDETFDSVMDINFHSVVHGTRIALRYFETQGAGTIVNMASVAGHIAPPFMSAYAASKHAVVGFTRALQEELHLANSSVQLLLVSPGFVDTAILNKGNKLGFPNWLQWLLASPDSVAAEILKGIRKGKKEIEPTFNGRAALNAHRIFPRTVRRSAKVLLTRKFSDLLLNRYDT